ncbi:MAG TPA: MarR family transcriptional regulator [Pseudonocardia sp.]|jgi:DNA-binding MarR family transcriptional regulator|uniref:MarR family winged helix-turn-helix transcriptional regulator n=1 Tax=Pseudonocardia sp. TaxID=60912 RepID=UPI002B4B0808|nr:MarR family transcriptional regulator [Pseudonocardia sp.]HLU54924.1 MarR family transcriptional regulator [Pseudonocardia sp.]
MQGGGFEKAFDDEAAVRLRRVIGKLARSMNESASSEELTPTQASVLGVVVARGPIRISAVAELEGVNPTMLSRVMGVLEQKGLIRRSSATSDLRGVVAEATDAGREKSRRILERRTATLRAVVERLPPETVAALVDALPALEELTAAFAERRPTLAREG